MIKDLVNLIYYNMKIYLQKKQVFSFDGNKIKIYLAGTRKEINLIGKWEIYKDDKLVYSYDGQGFYQKRHYNFKNF